MSEPNHRCQHCGAKAPRFEGRQFRCRICSEMTVLPADGGGTASVHCAACGARNARPGTPEFLCASCGERTVLSGPDDESDGICDPCGEVLYFGGPGRYSKYCPSCGSEELLDRLGRKPVEVAARLAAIRKAAPTGPAASAPTAERPPGKPDPGSRAGSGPVPPGARPPASEAPRAPEPAPRPGAGPGPGAAKEQEALTAQAVAEMRALGLVNEADFAAKPSYARTVREMGSRFAAAADGDVRAAVHLYLAGVVGAGDGDLGLAAHALRRRGMRASWREYAGVRAEIDALWRRLPPASDLAKHVARWSRDLRDRTPLLVSLYALFGALFIPLAGLVAFGVERQLSNGANDAGGTQFADDARDLAASVIGFLLLLPFGLANRLGRNNRRPIVNPRWTVWLLLVAVGLFLELLATEYVAFALSLDIPVSLEGFGALLHAGVTGSWLFSMPLVVVAGTLLAAGGILAVSNPLPETTADGLDELLSSAGLGSVHWLVLAAISAALSAAVRGVLLLLGA